MGLQVKQTAVVLRELPPLPARFTIKPPDGLAEYEFPPGMPAYDLFNRPQVPSDFVLPGFIAGTVGALIAPGSTGKSMLAMELASTVAGSSILGDVWKPKKTGAVITLAVEDPENELYNRWGQLGESLSEAERLKHKQVQVIPMFGRQFDIMSEACFVALVKLCYGKRLLILDTLRRIHTLEENDSGQMSQVVAKMEEVAALTGCSILFLHHTNKGSTFAGSGSSQQASRGSSVLVDNIRFQMFMVGMNEEMVKAEMLNIPPEDFKHYVKLGVSKVNYGPKLGDVWLMRKEGGILKPVDTLEMLDVDLIERTSKRLPASTEVVNAYQAAKDGMQPRAKIPTGKNYNNGNW